ncbi:alkaline phosphatase, tissue-nonspecific isozyme-like [Saccostrea echinata]|uniref:alkaline phosphatase, tissue-nonspecific isozyme-like n=1 Tax=Saccostrea echinata TaxID=191078 RepID=UPI002A826AC7|nr:alkaline phosphatase, tissue-nonspecific isozyme-like [Saccostrea echinata]
MWLRSILVFFALIYGGRSEDWTKMAKDELDNALKIKPNTGFAKNVIVFIGDGLGISTINAARIYKGQKQGNPGEETVLEWEKFPNAAFSKIYGSDKQVPDSAQTATAILGGVKVNYKTVGVTDSIKGQDCAKLVELGDSAKVKSVIRKAQDDGKSTGVVTTARITHATPASTYAHSAHRNWESDADLTQEANGVCRDIAYQLVHSNNDIQVYLGGGRRAFYPKNFSDPETGATNVNKRLDNRNLVEEWQAIQTAQNRKHKYVWKKDDFDSIDEKDVDYVLGLFSPSHMAYEIERNNSGHGEPSLTEMTSKAIKILQKNKKGFVLLAEGAKIDIAHHDSLAKIALEDTLEFERAVKEAVSLTNPQETLIIVTADHSHAFSLAGYTKRGNDVLGLVDDEAVEIEPPLDKKPYTALVYGNGPGWNEDRQNLTGVATDANNYVQQSAVPLAYETHSAEDVGIFAQGPMSHLLHGVHEQHYIAHVIQYASCIGDYRDSCDKESRLTSDSKSLGPTLFLLFLSSCIQIFF